MTRASTLHADAGTDMCVLMWLDSSHTNAAHTRARSHAHTRTHIISHTNKKNHTHLEELEQVGPGRHSLAKGQEGQVDERPRQQALQCNRVTSWSDQSWQRGSARAQLRAPRAKREGCGRQYGKHRLSHATRPWAWPPDMPARSPDERHVPPGTPWPAHPGPGGELAAQAVDRLLGVVTPQDHLEGAIAPGKAKHVSGCASNTMT